MRPDALSPDWVQAGNVGSVKGGGYRTVGRRALSTRKKRSQVHFYNEDNDHVQHRGDKAHILRMDGRLTRCHWQGEEMHDVVLKRKKDIGWRDCDK